MDFLKKSHEPYVVIASGDAVYKMDYSKFFSIILTKKADVTVVCKEMDPSDDVSRFGTIRMDDDMRITEFEEKPMVTKSNMISTGIYVIRRRLLIDLIEHAAEEERFDFVNDVLIRYKNLKKIYGYKIDHYWSNIATVDEHLQIIVSISECMIFFSWNAKNLPKFNHCLPFIDTCSINLQIHRKRTGNLGS